MTPIAPVGLGLSPLPPVTLDTTTAFPAANAAPGSPASAFDNFGNMLGAAIDAINGTQAQADAAATQLVTGQSTDLHAVMIDMEKAKVTFDLAVQVRNKSLDAYNELMHTQV